jgi:uncharacterized protein YicC (UPF0701 family)
MNQEQNTVLTAINAVLSNFTQQIVEQATKPLLERITVLESQLNERTLVELHNDWVAVLQCNLLDEVDNKIGKALKSVGSSDIGMIRQLVDEHLENQPTINADDISGLKNFVRDVVDEVHRDSIEADDIDGLDKFVRDVIDEVSEDDDSVTEKVKEALRAAADSI